MWNYSSGKLIFLCKRGLIWGDNRQTILDKTDVVANFVNQWKPLLSTPPKKFEPGKWLLSVHPPFSVPPAISVEAAASQESPGLMLCSYSFSRLYPLRIYLTCDPPWLTRKICKHFLLLKSQFSCVMCGRYGGRMGEGVVTQLFEN